VKPKIAIIGGGCSGLSLACSINTNDFEVSLFEKKNRLGSKLLVAGKGGFNLTHSEPLSKLKRRYRPASLMDKPLSYFSNTDFIKFLENINIETYEGSSRRIFPVQTIKPIGVLNAIEEAVMKNNVNVKTNTEILAFEKSGDCIKLELLVGETNRYEEFNIVVFSLGGGSWKITGSDGRWINMFKANNIKVNPFQPSNCAIKVNWPKEVIDKIEGVPIKNIAIRFYKQSILGEIMVTNFGLEGTPI